MFHKVKSVSPLPNYKLSVGFSEGIVKLYDIKPLFEKIPAFTYLKEHPELESEIEAQIRANAKSLYAGKKGAKAAPAASAAPAEPAPAEAKGKKAAPAPSEADLDILVEE